jgi:hypothetical protein
LPYLFRSLPAKALPGTAKADAARIGRYWQFLIRLLSEWFQLFAIHQSFVAVQYLSL